LPRVLQVILFYFTFVLILSLPSSHVFSFPWTSVPIFILFFLPDPYTFIVFYFYSCSSSLTFLLSFLHFPLTPYICPWYIYYILVSPSHIGLPTASFLVLFPYIRATFIMFSLLLYPEDVGSTFLENVVNNLPDYVASHHIFNI
jgi:hypothetical protein